NQVPAVEKVGRVTAASLLPRALTSVPAGAGTEISRYAPIVAHREIFIEAPVDCVWRILVDVSRWPEWLPDVAGLGPHPAPTPGAHRAVPAVVGAGRRGARQGLRRAAGAVVWRGTGRGTGALRGAGDAWGGLALSPTAHALRRPLEPPPTPAPPPTSHRHPPA